MFRLTVIAGPANAQPARGSSFAVESGRLSIGRHSSNEIVVQSGNVSKRHCVLVVDNTQVFVEDQGSSNGTFVNGKLTPKKSLRMGDRIGVGEYVFELTAEGGNVIPLRSGESSQSYAPLVSPAPISNSPGSHAPSSMETFEDAVLPKDLLGKLKYHFDRYILPYFFSFNERYEWRVVMAALFAVFLGLNLVISLSPLMDAQKRAMDREMSHRAKVMARELAERNTPFVAAKLESKLDLGTFEKADGVRTALIIDLDHRILAPATQAGNYFQYPPAASGLAVKARKSFIEGKQDGIVSKPDSSSIVAVEPIQILNPALGKNETKAIAVVVLDATLSALEGGALWLVYGHALVLSILVGFFVFYLMYRVTLRPLQEMNSKIDRTLRGEHVEFKPSVYFSEIDPLWSIVDSALKRVPKDGSGVSGPAVSAFTVQDLIGPLRALGENSRNGIAVLDESRRIVYFNYNFKDLCLNHDAEEGKTLQEVARDQAFSAMASDLCDRTQPGSGGITESNTFSGIDFNITVVAFGQFGDPKCYVFNISKKEDA